MREMTTTKNLKKRGGKQAKVKDGTKLTVQEVYL